MTPDVFVRIAHDSHIGDTDDTSGIGLDHGVADVLRGSGTVPYRDGPLPVAGPYRAGLADEVQIGQLEADLSDRHAHGGHQFTIQFHLEEALPAAERGDQRHPLDTTQLRDHDIVEVFA